MPDNTYGFEGVGGNVYDALQQTLLTQAAQKRQSMLDSLNQQNVQSEMDYRKQQADSLAEQRAATAEWRKSQADAVKEKAFQNQLQYLDPTQPLDDNDPIAQELTKRHMLTSRTDAPVQPSVSTSVVGGQMPSIPGTDIQGQSVDMMGMPGMKTLPNPDGTMANTGPVDITTPDSLQPVPTTHKYFTGTPAYQHQQKVIQGIQGLVKSPNYGTMTPEQKLLQMMAIDPEGKDIAPFERLMQSPTEQQEPIPIFDEGTGKTSYATGPDGKQILGKSGEHWTRTRPPQPNAAAQPQIVSQADPDHPGQFLQFWLKPGEQPSPDNQIKGGGFRGAIPPHNPPVKPGDNNLYGKTEYSKYVTAIGSKKPQEIATALQGVINTISDPEAQQDVRAFFTPNIDPTIEARAAKFRAMPAAQLVSQGVISGSPEHVQKVIAILSALRGK